MASSSSGSTEAAAAAAPSPKNMPTSPLSRSFAKMGKNLGRLGRKVTKSVSHAKASVSAKLNKKMPRNADSDLTSSIDILHSGWLEKVGGFNKNWKNRFVILRPAGISYYGEEKDATGPDGIPRGAFAIENQTVIMNVDSPNREGFAFVVLPSAAKGSRRYVFLAKTEEARKQWMQALLKIGCLEQDATSNVIHESLTEAAHEGYLLKVGAILKQTYRRFLVLRGGSLSIYEERFGDHSPAGVLNVTGAHIAVLPSPTAPAPGEKPQGYENAFSVRPLGTRRDHILVAKSEEERTAWLNALRGAGARDAEMEEELIRSSTIVGNNSHTGSISLGPGQRMTVGSGADVEGWLFKLGDVRKNWKRRFFTLRGDTLSYFENMLYHSKSKGDIIISGASINVCSVEAYGKANAFLLAPTTTNRLYVFVADSSESRSNWMRALKLASKGLSPVLNGGVSGGVGTREDSDSDSATRAPRSPSMRHVKAVLPEDIADEYLPVFKAIKKKDFKMVANLLSGIMEDRFKQVHALADHHDYAGATAMHLAVLVVNEAARQRAVVSALIAAGAPLSAPCSKPIKHTWIDEDSLAAHKYTFDKATPLHVALVVDGDEVYGSRSAQHLLYCGADANLQAKLIQHNNTVCEGVSALALAIMFGSARYIPNLCRSGADVNAITESLMESVSFRTRRGADLHRKVSLKNAPPIMLGICQGDAELVDALLRAGADASALCGEADLDISHGKPACTVQIPSGTSCESAAEMVGMSSLHTRLVAAREQYARVQAVAEASTLPMHLGGLVVAYAS